MLHQGTASTPNHLPNAVRFEPAGCSLTPMCLTASARASTPGALPAVAGAAGGVPPALARRLVPPAVAPFAVPGAAVGFAFSAVRVSAPTQPSAVSLRAFWKAFTAAAVAGP